MRQRARPLACFSDLGERKLEPIKKRIQQLQKKRPGYKEILHFYERIKREQRKIQSSLHLKPLSLGKEWKELLKKEGFPLVEKKEFPIDLEVSKKLFLTLCEIGKEANPHMAQQIKKIEEALQKKKIDLQDVIRSPMEEGRLDRLLTGQKLDKKLILFLAYESLQPSIQASVEGLHAEGAFDTWLKGYCPICGSQPHLSLLRDAEGKRFLLCSFCGYSWRVDRMTCPFCMNTKPDSLLYFYGEGEEAYRIDTCDQCHQYIKTIDTRKLEMIDPVLEDLATLHLDLLASQKGYQRPVPHPWISAS